MTEKIGILSKGGKAYFYIIKELTNLKIPFIESEDIKNLTNVNVILTTVRVSPEIIEIPSGIKIFYLPENILFEDAQIIILEAIYYSKRKKPPKNIIFGIDPGNKRYGFVCILDDVVIKREIYRDRKKVINEIIKLTKKINFREKIYIFFGGGTKTNSFNTFNYLVREMISKKHDIVFKIIDENNSSKYGNDAVAAYYIALRGVSRYLL